MRRRLILIVLSGMAAPACSCEEGTECEVTVRFEGREAAASRYMSDATKEANPREHPADHAARFACRTICSELHPSGEEPWYSEASNARQAIRTDCILRCEREGTRDVSCERSTETRGPHVVPLH